MRHCALCNAALMPLEAETVGYLRVEDGEPVALRTYQACACCVSRSQSHPFAVRDAMRRAYAKGVS